ncbi:MAG TPA: polysaccharide biosynthesis tyrosine autokinase [Chthoniobacterales bacterium]
MADKSEMNLHILDYWRVIRVRFGIILLAFLLVLITASVVTYFMPKQYQSSVTMEVQSDSAPLRIFQGGDNEGFPAADPRFLTTQFQILQSKEILYQVIDKLNLAQQWYPGTPIPKEQIYYQLRGMINLQEVRGANIIQIRVLSRKPKEAAIIANTVADVYAQRRIEELNTQTIKSLAKLQDEVDLQQKRVDDAFADATRIREEEGIVDLNPNSIEESADTSVSNVQASAAKVNETKTNADLLRNQIEQIDKLNDADFMRGLSLLSIPDTIVGARIQSYQAAIVDRESLLKSGLGQKHPSIQALNTQIDIYTQQAAEQVQSIRKGLVAQLRIAQNNLTSMEQILEDSQKGLNASRNMSARYIDAKNRYIQRKKVLEAAEMKLTTSKIEKTMPMSPTRIWDRAEPATSATKPNVRLNIALGIIVGLIVGLGLAFAIEYLDTSVKTLDDVETFLGTPVLAVIPKNIHLLHRESNDTADAEAYRILRTNIEFNRKNSEANSVTLVSGGPGEGKSTTLANLAIVCAQGGYDVLIVDADLRRPSQHTIFGVSNAVGLSNYLTTDMQIEDVILPTGVNNLQIMPSGILPSDAAGILNSRRMADLIALAKSRYDLVLLDSPPILGVSDASVLASEVDITVIVVQHRRFPRSMLLRVKQAVTNVGGTLLGVVLNNVDLRHDSSYQYYTSYNDYYATPARKKKTRVAQQPKPADPSEPATIQRDEY